MLYYRFESYLSNRQQTEVLDERSAGDVVSVHEDDVPRQRWKSYVVANQCVEIHSYLSKEHC